jgi:hypothetical protein
MQPERTQLFLLMQIFTFSLDVMMLPWKIIMAPEADWMSEVAAATSSAALAADDRC